MDKTKEQRFDDFLEKVNKTEKNFIELETKVNEIIGVVNTITAQFKNNNEFIYKLYEALKQAQLIADPVKEPEPEPEPETIPEDMEEMD